MAGGHGRRAGAWLMLASAVVVAAGIMVVANAVGAFERQVADLDPNEQRAGATLYSAATGAIVVGAGLLFFLVSWIVFGVGSRRARKSGAPVETAHGIIAAVSGVAIVLALLFATLSPNGPLMLAASVAAGGGGTAGGVQLETFEGNLTAMSISGGPSAGPMNARNVHAFDPVSQDGALKMRIGSGGSPQGLYAIAILEARDGAGRWNEVARTEPTGDSEVSVPMRRYDGELRFIVRLPDGSFGQVQYLLAVSFDPAK